MIRSLFLGASLAIFVLSGRANDSYPKIETTSGSFVGVFNNSANVEFFKGIPFAKPPVGKLRFAPPEAIRLEGEQDASTFRDACPQPESPGIDGYHLGPPLHANQSEDCLYLNIWVPKTNGTQSFSDHSLPVMVYIHGGAYIVGSGSEWDPTGFIKRSMAIKKPLIFVSISYRLGSLGFLGSSKVPKESLNVGFQDQRFALRWIKENTPSFGGDPEKITISGESVGGAAVHFQFLYSDSENLFRAGISDSGTPLVINTPACEFLDKNAYPLIGNFTGCGTGEESFECLRDLPLETFWNASVQADAASGAAFSPWSPCIGPEGSYLEEYPANKYLNGDFLDLPIITGTNLNEGELLVGGNFLDLPPMSPENETTIFTSFVESMPNNGHVLSNSTVSTILKLWPNIDPPQFSNSSLYERASQFFNDLSFLAPQRLFLDATVKLQRDNVWAYSFGQKLPGAPDFLGIFHSSELYFLDIGFSQVPAENLTHIYQDYYINFVNDLDPGSSWKKYTASNKNVLQLIDGNVTMIPDVLRKNGTDFLNDENTLAEFGRLG